MNWPWTPSFPQQPFPQTYHAQPPPPPPQFFATAPPYPPPFQPYNPALQQYQQYQQHIPPPPPQFTPPPPPQRAVPRQQGQPQRGQSLQQQAPQPPRRDPKAKDASARDLATAHDTARKLGAKLPGNNEDEIRRWVEARKKNWPSRANVQRKREQEREKAKEREAKVALEKLREYGSSADEAAEKNDKGKRKRGRRRRGRGRGGKGVCKDLPLAKRRPTLLKILLKEEIEQERAVLLQAFRYLVRQRHRAQNGDPAGV